LSCRLLDFSDLQSASYGTALVSGNAAAHEVGIYLLAWTIFTFICLLCVLRVNIAMILLFGLLDVTFLLLTISRYQTGNSKATTVQAAGYTGIVTGLVSLYIVLAGLATKENTYFTLPVGPIPALHSNYLR
jgi:succinate-acetate transporter protein